MEILSTVMQLKGFKISWRHQEKEQPQMSLKSQALDSRLQQRRRNAAEWEQASYGFGCIIKHFPDIVSDPESGNWYMSEVVDISGSSDGSPLARGGVMAIFRNHNPANTANHGPLAHDYKSVSMSRKKEHGLGRSMIDQIDILKCFATQHCAEMAAANLAGAQSDIESEFQLSFSSTPINLCSNPSTPLTTEPTSAKMKSKWLMFPFLNMKPH